MSWRIVFNTIFIIIFVAGFFAWKNLYVQAPVPCEKPITYTIGAFDRRFGISQKDFLSALAEAEKVWEKPIGRELFIYKPESSELSVNLVYDRRQEVTNTLTNLGNKLEENESYFKALQKRYTELKSEYDGATNIYDARVLVFDEKNNFYKEMVRVWDSGKRVSKEQFDELERKKLALERELSELKILETKLNERVREINALVGTLNSLAQSLNLGAEKYNTIGASRGETFTGGVYSQSEEERSIDVYEFSNREKLVRILAHELGHALGLDHNSDPKAIMYHLNEGEAESLTPTDLAVLQTLCYTKDISN